DLEAVPSLRAKAMEQWQDPQLLLTIARRFNLLALFNDELATLEQAAALDPSNRAIQLDRGLSLLRFGRFAEGWPLFEWRRTGFKPAVSLPNLEPGLVCQSLLILPEDGLGDQIMFASLLDQSVALAPDQAVVVDPRLRSLMERSFPHLQVITTAETIQTNQFQAQIRMGSLAAHQPPSQAHFHAHRKAYLSADPGKTQALRHRHLPNPRSGELLCGISWRSTSPANGAMKSVNLEALAKALALPGVRLLSLQYGDTQAERDDLRRSTGLEVLADPQIDPFADIDGLAALINACDLVVSVSNTTAHLAAGLGQRTWLLIDSRLDWRWGLDDPDSLWSPTTRLFRQPDPGDWATPLGTIQEELTILQRHHPLRSALDAPGPGARPSPPPEANRKWVF
ncbi:MAG: hypothetical protein VKP70_07760, partial [Cyanobacteriota bacterium]|nr:hypothetical protein [Cyanobacteriota bacterium]